MADKIYVNPFKLAFGAAIGALAATIAAWSGLFMFAFAFMKGEGSLFDSDPQAAEAFVAAWATLVVMSSALGGILPHQVAGRLSSDVAARKPSVAKRACQQLFRACAGFFGVFIGFAFSAIPALVADFAHVAQCVEGCPNWLRGVSWTVYGALPLLWGALMTFAFGAEKRVPAVMVLGAAVASIILMSVITVLGHILHFRLLWLSN